MMNYVVIGRGDAPESVITDSLLDLGKDTHFYVPWIGGTSTRPSEGMRKVYDFLVDTKATFTLIAKDRSAVHAELLSACVVVKECGSDQPDMNFANIPSDATVLMLWDDEHSEGPRMGGVRVLRPGPRTVGPHQWHDPHRDRIIDYYPPEGGGR